MFTYQGPVHALTALRQYLMMHGADLPEDQRDRLVQDAAQNGVPAILAGMERLLLVALSDGAPEASEPLLMALGELASVVWQDNFNSQAERGAQIAAWAASQLEPVAGAPLPDVPEIDPAYVVVSPPDVLPDPEAGLD